MRRSGLDELYRGGVSSLPMLRLSGYTGWILNRGWGLDLFPRSQRIKMMKPGTCRWILVIAGLALVLATDAKAQLLLDNPDQRWMPGETIELYLPRKDGVEVRLETVLFDDRQVPFDLLTPRNANEAIRIRLRVPAGVKPGARQISAVLSETLLTTVPRILGMALDEARQALEGRGLALDAGAPAEASGELVATSVSEQRPAAGARVRPGTRVAVTTSTEVPDIAGLLVEAARLELEPRGLTLDVSPIAGVAAPVETLVVMRYEPLPGAAVVTGSSIQVREVAVSIPELTGLGLDAARQILLDGGFVPLVTLHEPADGPYETVLAQLPAAGTPAAPDSGVRLAAESRPDPPGPRWPVPEAAVVAALAASLQRARKKHRRARQKTCELEVHADLQSLRAGSKAESLEIGELAPDRRSSDAGPVDFERRRPPDSAANDKKTVKDLFFSGKEGGYRQADLAAGLRNQAPLLGGFTEEIVTRIGEVLGIDLGEVLSSAWEKVEELRELADTEEGEPMLVPLAGHAIGTEFQPHIDVKIGKVALGRIQLDVELELALEGVMLKVEEGKIRGLEAGSCGASGVLACSFDTGVVKKELLSLEREMPVFELPGLINFGNGISLPLPGSRAAS